MKRVDEEFWQNQFQEKREQQFYRAIERYDEKMIPVMKARGYTCIRSAERTVAFTFGEFTFSRRKWKKGKKWICPVDEYLGLEKNVRYSKELIYQIAELATMMTYDSVVRVLKMTYGVMITKPTVVKVVKMTHELLEKYDDYQYYQDESTITEKLASDLIYLEGDGVCVKAYDPDDEVHNREVAHFVVHTGSEKVEKKRWLLQNKKSFVSLKNSHARRKVLDYLHQQVQITDQTVLVTNSDGGKGYSPYVFKEIAKALRVKRHEHFWDEYHLNQKLKTFFRPYPVELLEKAFQSIQLHDKSLLRTVFDTIEGLIETEEEFEEFEHFKNKLLRNFQYTKPAELRGLSHAGIGVMESQHRKITYRMKKKGMVWSEKGVNAMTNMIVLSKENRLRELFFGQWREDYEKIQHAEQMTGGQLRIQENNVKRDEARYSLKQKW